MKRLTKKQKQFLCDTAHKCDYEGGLVGGYAGYGIDYEAVKLLGFDADKVSEAVSLLDRLATALDACTELGENPYE